MTMKRIEINVPETLVDYMGLDDINSERLRNAMIVYPYVKNGTISHGKAAELLGMNKMELIQLYGSIGLPYFDETPEELEEELTMMKELREATVC
ncbi:MAG: UPF0175 family protein [Tyzzerella sp.]|nr:UPF0175 family protein [Tyzzerella sp.]